MFDSAERMKLLKEQQQWAREEAEAKRAERQREADIRTAGQETLSRVGEPTAFRTAGGAMGPAQPTDAQNRLADDEYYRNMGGRQSQAVEENLGVALPKGDASKMFPKQEMYTQEQAEKDYLKRLRGLDVGKAMQYEKGALELGELKRSARYAQKQEDALGFQQNIMSDLKNNGGDAAAVIEKHFLPLYNEDKLPGFKDGGKATLVPSAMGGDKSIVITYKDGKQETMPANMKTLQELTSHTQSQMMASSTPENYWKSKDQYIKERQVAATEKTAEASATQASTQAKHLDAQIKADLFGAQAAQARGAANASNAHAAVYKNMVDLAKSNKDAAEAMKPFLTEYGNMSAEDQVGSKGQAKLVEAATAAAKKTGDITGIINQLKKPDKSGIESQWNPIEAKLIEQNAKPEEIEMQRTQFMARRGYAPSASLAVMESGINPQTKKPLTEADINAFNKRYPNSAIDKSALPWLKQQKDYEARVNAIPR
jgi:hypothetical protein